MASCRIETLADSNASREATHGRNLTALGCVGRWRCAPDDGPAGPKHI